MHANDPSLTGYTLYNMFCIRLQSTHFVRVFYSHTYVCQGSQHWLYWFLGAHELFLTTGFSTLCMQCSTHTDKGVRQGSSSVTHLVCMLGASGTASDVHIIDDATRLLKAA